MGLTKPNITVDTSYLMRPHAHGFHEKDMVVCHETVSHEIPGLADGNSVASYLAAKDYGIHGVIDQEGHLWWAKGMSQAIFWHCTSTGAAHQDKALVNTRSIGIELISYPSSNVRLMSRNWIRREKQLAKLAHVLAWQSRIHRFPLHVSKGLTAGVTTHWDVSHTFEVPGGHTDCFPGYEGGYFPLIRAVYMARALRFGHGG